MWRRGKGIYWMEVDGLNFAGTNHDNGKKTFLNETGSFGGEDIGKLFLNKKCGDFIAIKCSLSL